ncbi:hypothetical protein B0H14DRAFT_2649691 [Mycena olivaceomarginata]|nr:hypothetical protein B0H14DRAFT_2649691 [Mycena olivaceomarginata]
MPSAKFIFKEIGSFRLGYTEQRPYPSKWTTPIVLCTFLLAAVLLAAINVPLSAYDIVQEFTYRPNDTLPPLPLGNLIPSVLQNPTDSFTPNALAVGDRIVLNGSIFDYTVDTAFDNSTLVSSFPYYNNALSTSCDVTNMTINLVLLKRPVNTTFKFVWESQVQVIGLITCHIPTLFHLTWNKSPVAPILGHFATDPLGKMTAYMAFDFVTISFTVVPCCDCDAIHAGAPPETTSLLQNPCSSKTPRFVAVGGNWWFGSIGEPPDAQSATSRPYMVPQFLNGIIDGIPLPILDVLYENLIQTVYHLARLDLGVILPNQIYASPEVFNRAIVRQCLQLSITAPGYPTHPTHLRWPAGRNRWIFFKHSDRVPVMEYLRPVPHLKPLGSAITSVFVSTFAMLSVMWTIFSFIAGALTRSRTTPSDTGHLDAALDGTNENLSYHEKLAMEEVWDESKTILLAGQKEPNRPRDTLLDQLCLDMENMEKKIRLLTRMRLSLKKDGLLKVTDSDDEMEMALEHTKIGGSLPIS